MKTQTLKPLVAATLVLLSVGAFADGRHARPGGRPSVGPRYAYVAPRPYVNHARHRPYAGGAYASVYGPVYPGYYAYDDYWYGAAPVRYAPYPPAYRPYVAYRPYPVYRYRPTVGITVHIGGRR